MAWPKQTNKQKNTQKTHYFVYCWNIFDHSIQRLSSGHSNKKSCAFFKKIISFHFMSTVNNTYRQKLHMTIISSLHWLSGNPKTYISSFSNIEYRALWHAVLKLSSWPDLIFFTLRFLFLL